MRPNSRSNCPTDVDKLPKTTLLQLSNRPHRQIKAHTEIEALSPVPPCCLRERRPLQVCCSSHVLGCDGYSSMGLCPTFEAPTPGCCQLLSNYDGHGWANRNPHHTQASSHPQLLFFCTILWSQKAVNNKSSGSPSAFSDFWLEALEQIEAGRSETDQVGPRETQNAIQVWQTCPGEIDKCSPRTDKISRHGAFACRQGYIGGAQPSRGHVRWQEFRERMTGNPRSSNGALPLPVAEKEGDPPQSRIL
jgi:hypothetical protein